MLGPCLDHRGGTELEVSLCGPLWQRGCCQYREAKLPNGQVPSSDVRLTPKLSVQKTPIS
jgi:hypothetical protein